MKILITAGPTYERIDPVRFIGNYSSGKMGLALVAECVKRGMDVVLVLGPVSINHEVLNNLHVTLIQVESAAEMYTAAVNQFPYCDAAILCAAVADFTPVVCADKKIKRQGDELIIRLKPTQDIAAHLGNMKTERQILAGFALETNDEDLNAHKKLEKKKLDFIVLNSLNDEGAGFRHDTNKITIIDRKEETAFPLLSKEECAVNIIDHLWRLLKTC